MGRILVTGGAGYIGSHTCKALHEAGHQPITYDNLSTGFKDAVKWGPLEHGDIRDADRLNQVLDRHSPEAVIHFAADAYVGESIKNPIKYYSNNVAGTITLLSCLIEKKIRRIVFSSTCATYGTPDAIPIDENEPQAPINPYGNTKWIVEKMLKDYTAPYGLSVAALRYFNAAGADLENEVGENHDPETHLIPLALQAVKDKSSPLTIFGDDFPTIDGTCVRDYIHVNDLASAHLKALKFTEINSGFEAFNLGSENGYSVLDIINAIEAITGGQVRRTIGGRRKGDPATLIASAKKAKAVLKWEPQHSDINTIVSTAWNWMNRE